MTLGYRGEAITFDMPGWCCDGSEEGIHTSADMKISDRMLGFLKARAECRTAWKQDTKGDQP